MTQGAAVGLRLHAITWEAEDVRSFEFRERSGGELPPATPGAHIDVRLPGNLERSYSLIDVESPCHRYRIAVQRAQESRGGSVFLFDGLKVGDIVEVTSPINQFTLREDVPLVVFIAGGIGITPLWCMIQRLEALGKAWRLHYACRTRARAAFVAQLEHLERQNPGRVFFVFDGEPGSPKLDIDAVISSCPADAHLYCCGPAGMLGQFEKAAASVPAEQRHVEYFSAAQAPARGGFEVVLARSGTTLHVPEDQTIMQAMLSRGLEVSRSCMSGVCGTCETTVLEGVPDHRDQVLSERERASNRKMMICCSGSVGPRLVLDL